jgi:hypothetical protein
VRIAALLVLAACGDNATAPCTATFTGSFADDVRSTAACPELHDGALAITFDSPVLGGQVGVELDLGDAATTGRYSEQTVFSWHAVEAKSLGDGACIFSAGDSVTPHGSFTLQVDATEPDPHGVLDVVQYVHAVDGTDCGPADVENVHVDF